ncbi:MAG: extracellular solute-binding protein [Treponema sp.]|nr:extracellular solute-binding protein [Treponema sp.]
MSLLENDNINNNNPKTTRKSILSGGGMVRKFDIFLILVVLIMIITPVFVNLVRHQEIKTKQITLSLSLRSEELLGKEITKNLLIEFNEKNPDVQIHLQLQSEDTAPDILIFDEGDFSALVAAKMLSELKSSEFVINAIPEEEIENAETENLQIDDSLAEATQMAVPLVSFMNLLFYNIDILSEAGFDHPPKTREEFSNYARKVSISDFSSLPGGHEKIYGTALSLSSEDRQSLARDIFSWIWAAGGDFWTDEDKPTLNTRAITADLNYLGSLYRGEMLAPGIFKTTGVQRIDEFAQGRIALMIESTRAIPYLREKMGNETFGITTIPGAGTGGKYSINISSIYAGIESSISPDNISYDTMQNDKKSNEKLINEKKLYDEMKFTAAMDFLKFLAEKSDLFCDRLNAIPGSLSNPIPGDYVRIDPFYSKAWDIFEASRIVHGFSGKPGAEEYKSIFLEELRNFFEGSQTAAQTVTAIQRRWDVVEAED